MKTLWYIAKKDLLQITKDRNGLILMLVVPLVLISIVGFAFGSFYGDGSSQIQIKVALNNQETAQDAFIGKTIASALKVKTSQLAITVNEYRNPAHVREQVGASNDAANVGIVIPAGATQTLTAGHVVKVGPFDQALPGYAIFFSLFGLNAVAATILQEKEDGTFRRLLIAPIQKYALLGGKMLAQFIVTMAQLSIIFLVGYVVFKVHMN